MSFATQPPPSAPPTATFTGTERGTLLGIEVVWDNLRMRGYVEPFGDDPWLSVIDLADFLQWRPSEVLAQHARLKDGLREAPIFEPESEDPLIAFSDACQIVLHRARFGRGGAPRAIHLQRHILTRLMVPATHAMVETTLAAREAQGRLWAELRGGAL